MNEKRPPPATSRSESFKSLGPRRAVINQRYNGETANRAKPLEPTYAMEMPATYEPLGRECVQANERWQVVSCWYGVSMERGVLGLSFDWMGVSR